MLIFVPGIAGVEELAEALSESSAFQLVPIHSTLELESQLAAFAPPPPGVTKIIAATNAAESSLTLPDVDLVIDLGVEKAVFWNGSHGSSELRRAWVSKASATQRAGRTGRVRPGRVVRLFTRHLFEGMSEHNQCEMSRQPLEDSVLQLRAMLPAGGSIRAILTEAMAPPDAQPLTRALVSLANAGILELPPPPSRRGASAHEGRVAAEGRAGSSAEEESDGGDEEEVATDHDEPPFSLASPRRPSPAASAGVRQRRTIATLADADYLDTASLTATGRLASALPLDHTLSRLVAVGVCLGCAGEAIVVAAGMGLGRSVYRVASPLVIEDTDECASLYRPGDLWNPPRRTQQ